MRKVPFLILLFSTLFFSCQDDDILEEREFPVIKTLEVTNINSTGVTFNGEWISTGKKRIKSYGFVWQESMWNEPLLPKDYYPSSPPPFVQYDGHPNTAIFTCRIENNLEKGKEYRVRVFAVTDDNTVAYGNLVYFMSK